jgi:glycosyltransferase involved in cell wall biosynthesis
MKFIYLRTFFNFNLKAGGSVSHTAGVINSLRKKVDLQVISNDVLPEVEADVRIIKPGLLGKGPQNNLYEILYNFKLRKILKNEIKIYDAIYHRYTGNSFIAAWFAKKYSIPLILEFNSSVVWAIKNWTIQQKFPKSLLRHLFNRIIRLPLTIRIEKYNLYHASIVVVVSAALKEVLLKMGVPESKILVNPNGVDPDKYSDKLNGNKVREKLQIGKDQLVYGFIGTFGQWHGILELARAINLFYDSYPELKDNTRFLLIGNGVLMPDVKKIIAASDYKNNVILTGLVDQNAAPEYLAACDIFLSPHIPNKDGSKFFGSPTKLFEYMAIGKPIIASNLDQIGEILSHNEDAYLVKPGDIEDLALAMKTLADDHNLRNRLEKKAREKVLNQYSWEKHVDRLLEKFQAIKNNKS